MLMLTHWAGTDKGTETSRLLLKARIDIIQLNGPLAPGITLVAAENLQSWLMDIKVMDDNPLYMGKIYRLKFDFSPSYPIGMESASINAAHHHSARANQSPQKLQRSYLFGPTTERYQCIHISTRTASSA